MLSVSFSREMIYIFTKMGGKNLPPALLQARLMIMMMMVMMMLIYTKWLAFFTAVNAERDRVKERNIRAVF